MPATDKAFYLTTPIYYVNDAPHIGHAYTTTAGDVLTRWHRQRGEKVWFLTGVDEHGTKVQRAAEDGGVTPQQWVDRLVEGAWRPVLGTIDAANDDFAARRQAVDFLVVIECRRLVRERRGDDHAVIGGLVEPDFTVEPAAAIKPRCINGQPPAAGLENHRSDLPEPLRSDRPERAH